MMFDLLDRPLVYIPVTWNGLGETADGGAVVVEHTIEVQVEILDRDEFQAWVNDGSEEVEDATARAAHELGAFKRVAKAWRKIKASGKTPEFNDANIARLLLFPGFVTACGETYVKAWRGRLETREGNSAGSPANGQGGEPTAETATVETPTS